MMPQATRQRWLASIVTARALRAQADTFTVQRAVDASLCALAQGHSGCRAIEHGEAVFKERRHAG